MATYNNRSSLQRAGIQGPENTRLTLRRLPLRRRRLLRLKSTDPASSASSTWPPGRSQPRTNRC
jgi:hypothetical protein